MLKEKCRFCGTRDHHQSEMHLCSAMKPETILEKVVREAPVAEIITDMQQAIRETTGVDKPLRPVGSPTAVEVIAALHGPLTNADRCKRYRLKDPAVYRERDRARKAKIRGSPKPE